MKCQACSSDRVLGVSARSKDQTSYSFRGEEYHGYPIDFGDNDNVVISICLECGMSVGDFPMESQLFEAERDEDE